MNHLLDYIDKDKSTVMIAWLIAFVIMIVGFNAIRNIVVYVLTKLYEIFIQHNVGN